MLANCILLLHRISHFSRRIVLNGLNVEEQLSVNKSALEHLAKKMTYRININYFDSEEISNRYAGLSLSNRDAEKCEEFVQSKLFLPSCNVDEYNSILNLNTCNTCTVP